MAEFGNVLSGAEKTVDPGMLKAIKAHWLFLLPLANFAAFYTLQNALGLLRLSPDLVLTFMGALAVAVASYLAAYILIPVGLGSSRLPASVVERLCITIVLVFVIVVITACATAERVPVFESIKGASAPELFADRSNFLRERAGPLGQLLNYSFAMLTQALMPLALAYAFYVGVRWRYWALGLFAVGVSVTLAKSAYFDVALPLIALLLMQSRFRVAAATFGGFIASIAVMSILASGVIGAWKAEAKGTAVAARQVELPADTPAQYNALGERNAVALVANRIVWIPYATALDWFRYQRDGLGGGYVMGRSIGPVAFLTGRERLQLEKEVAALQWGSSSGATSNAVFFADAWLNWGALGVMAYSAFLALTIKLIGATRFPPLIAAAAVPVWLACVSPLTPVYFSGGLGFLLLLALILRGPPLGAEQSQSVAMAA